METIALLELMQLCLLPKVDLDFLFLLTQYSPTLQQEKRPMCRLMWMIYPQQLSASLNRLLCMDNYSSILANFTQNRLSMTSRFVVGLDLWEL